MQHSLSSKSSKNSHFFGQCNGFLLCFIYIMYMSWYYWQIKASLPELKSCSLSTSLNKKCIRSIKDLKHISDFDDEKRKLLMLCCGLESISPICYYHERVYYVNHVLYLIQTVSAQSTGAGGYCLSEKVWEFSSFNILFHSLFFIIVI